MWHRCLVFMARSGGQNPQPVVQLLRVGIDDQAPDLNGAARREIGFPRGGGTCDQDVASGDDGFLGGVTVGSIADKTTVRPRQGCLQ